MAHTKRNKPQPGQFRLTMKMRRYIVAAAELTGTTKGYSQKDIAVAAGLSEYQVSRWHQMPGFRGAVAEFFNQLTLLELEAACRGLARQAAKGNIVAFNALCDRLERWGRIVVVSPQTSGADGAPDHMMQGVNVHIHRIPEPASRATLPPPLERPSNATTNRSLIQGNDQHGV